MASWDSVAGGKPQNTDEKEDNKPGKEYYTFVVHYPNLHPTQYLPHKGMYEDNGQPMQDKYKKDGGIRTEPCEMNEMSEVKVEAWKTKQDVLNALPSGCRTICNGLKAWLNKSSCSVFFHNAAEDKCSQFKGPHLHVVTRSEETTTGAFRRLYNVSAIRTLRKRVGEAGGYFRCEGVRHLSGLMNYLKQAPRIYMGANSRPLHNAFHEDVDVPYEDCVDEADKDEASAPTGEAFNGWHSQAGAKKRTAEDSWGAATTIELQPAKAMKVSYSATDDHMRILRVLMLYYNAYNLQDVWKRVGEVGDGTSLHDRYKETWKRMAGKPNVSRMMGTVKCSLESEWIGKPFAECIHWYCVNVCDRADIYETAESSYEMFVEWMNDQKIQPIEFIRQVFAIMDRKDPKFNTLCFIGPSNAGKTLMITTPLRALCRFVGQMANRSGNGDFSMMQLVNQRMIAMDECILDPKNMEDMKLLLGGEELRVQVKYSDHSIVERTPVVMTGNKEPWILDVSVRAAMENRMRYYPCVEIPELVSIKKQMNPRMWWYLSQFYMEDITTPPNVQDLIPLPAYAYEDDTLNSGSQ